MLLIISKWNITQSKKKQFDLFFLKSMLICLQEQYKKNWTWAWCLEATLDTELFIIIITNVIICLLLQPKTLLNRLVMEED